MTVRRDRREVPSSALRSSGLFSFAPFWNPQGSLSWFWWHPSLRRSKTQRLKIIKSRHLQLCRHTPAPNCLAVRCRLDAKGTVLIIFFSFAEAENITTAWSAVAAWNDKKQAWRKETAEKVGQKFGNQNRCYWKLYAVEPASMKSTHGSKTSTLDCSGLLEWRASTIRVRRGS